VQPAPSVALTAEQEEIARLRAQLAAAQAPPPVLTPEQQEIARLKAQLVAAQHANQATATIPANQVLATPAEVPPKVKARRGRPRNQPVMPAGNQPAPAQRQAKLDLPGEPVGSNETDDDEGDTPPNLDSRIDSLLKGSG
jgi:uncharacterized small protein (DUF1192 family)